MNLTKYLTFTMLLVAFSAFGQSKTGGFYYYEGEKIYFPLNTEYAFVTLSGLTTSKNLKTELAKKGIEVIMFEKENIRKKLNAIDHKPAYRQEVETSWAVLKFAKSITEQNYQSKLVELEQLQYILYAAPYFKTPDGEKIGLSNLFYVKLKKERDIAKLKELADKHRFEIAGQNKFMPLWYILSATKSSSFNAMDAANFFYETGLFKYAEPDLMVDNLFANAGDAGDASTTTAATASSDTYFDDQWALNNTGQHDGIPGMDINIEDAWEVTKGECVVVAVLDQGIEPDHPDLADNIFGDGYDTYDGTSPSQIRGRHGNPCAGIIGAVQNNNEGISGVAPKAKLMSVSSTVGSYTGIKNDLADGLNWAWQNGASIISNSWGHNMYDSSVIDDAIEDAIAYGRDGLGTVVVFLTGNTYFSIVYPAKRNPDILAVGAMSPCGEKTGLYSCDGEYTWGSCYGPRLDVVAPGVKISTTDLQGSQGYNTGQSDEYQNQDYTNQFNGTSSACPQVAGIAALVLSVNPSLTVYEVNDIIEQSARKVRTDLYTYSNTSGRPNGTWNEEMGYGLVDAAAAVALAAKGCGDELTTPSADCEDVEVEIDGFDITLLNANAADQVIKIRTPNWSWSTELCNDYNNNPSCTNGQSVTVPSTGSYVVDIQGYSSCTLNIYVIGNNIGTNAENYCDDCNGVTLSTCSAGRISADITASNVTYVIIMDQSWNTVGYLCNSWNDPNCDEGLLTAYNVAPGSYRVQVEYKNGSTCEFSNVVVGNNNKMAKQSRIANDLTSSTLSLYPNPAQTELTVNLGKFTDSETTITLFDVLGERMSSKQYPPQDQVTLDISELTDGVYFIVIENKDRKSEPLKMIKF